MNPAYQVAIGICVGLIVLLLTRRQYHNYHEESGNRSGTFERDCNNESSGSNYRPRFHSKSGDPCVICLVEMQSDNMTRLRCGHAMHTDCCNNCKLHSANCPICGERM